MITSAVRLMERLNAVQLLTCGGFGKSIFHHCGIIMVTIGYRMLIAISVLLPFIVVTITICCICKRYKSLFLLNMFSFTPSVVPHAAIGRQPLIELSQ